MTRPRLTRASLVLFLLLLVGVGIYLYKNLDSILQGQVQKALRDYGVVEYQLDQPRLRAGALSVARLRLGGHYGDHGFEASLQSLRVAYDWRTLLTGKVQSVSLSELDLTLSRTGATPSEPTTGPTRVTFTQVLPRELLASLPARSLDIGSLRVKYRAPGHPDLAVTGSLSYRERLAISLEAKLAGGEIALQLDSERGTSSIESNIELTHAGSRAAQVFVRLGPLDSGEWEWGLAGNWHSATLLDWLKQLTSTMDTPTVELATKGLTVSGTGMFDLQLRHPESFAMQAGPLWPQLQELDANMRLEGRFSKLHIPEVFSSTVGSVQQTYAVYSGLTLSGGQLEIRLFPLTASGQVADDILPIGEEARRWLKWGKDIPVTLQLEKPLVVGFDGDRWAGEVNDTALSLGDARSRVALEELQLDASFTAGDSPVANVMLGTLLTTRLREQPLPPLQLALQQKGPAQESAVHVELMAPRDSLEAELDGLVDLQRKRGELQFNLTSMDLHALSEAFAPPLRKLGVLGAELVIDTGSLNWDSQITGAEDWSQVSRFEMTGVSGHYDDYSFSGLSLVAEWRGLEEWRTTTPATLNLENLDAGFEISGINARISLPRPTPAKSPSAHIGSFTASLFGGRVFLPQAATWDFGAGSNSLTLRAEKWQLGQIVALQQSEDIRAEGLLEGELPVTVADGRIIIEEGYLRALPPGGTIRYLANEASRALGQSSKELELALNLLSDFRYEVLRSEVELDDGGVLQLGLSLTGSNPDQYDGRQINFNINLEQNLDPLLQSLRLSGKLTEEIENRLQ